MARTSGVSVKDHGPHNKGLEGSVRTMVHTSGVKRGPSGKGPHMWLFCQDHGPHNACPRVNIYEQMKNNHESKSDTHRTYKNIKITTSTSDQHKKMSKHT